MIRQYILDQLAKCSFATPISFDENTNTFIIPRYTKPKYDVGKCYIIQLQEQLLAPNSIIASNWNAGSVPVGKFLKAYVSKTMGKMIYVESVLYNIETGTDSTELWSGWLPVDEISQLAQVV